MSADRDYGPMVFRRMEEIYGSQFVARYNARQGQLTRTVETWGNALRDYSPQQIDHALNAMLDSEYPPSLPEFRALCRAAAPVARQIAQPEPYVPADPERAARAVSVVFGRGVSRRGNQPGREWARRLRAAFASGQQLLHCQISLASAALREVWAVQGGVPVIQPDTGRQVDVEGGV